MRYSAKVNTPESLRYNKPMPMHIVIYSHGFGVRKDDRGLFTDIAAALPGATHRMFDYNRRDETTGNLTVAPLAEQVGMLRNQIEKARADTPGAIIDLICHSQGCIVAALLAPRDVRKTLFSRTERRKHATDIQNPAWRTH